MSNSPFYFFSLLHFIEEIFSLSDKSYSRAVSLKLGMYVYKDSIFSMPLDFCPKTMYWNHAYFNQNTSIVEHFKKVISMVIELTNRKKNQWEILWNCNNLKFKCHVSKPYWSRQYFVLFYWIRTLIRIIFIHCHW